MPAVLIPDRLSFRPRGGRAGLCDTRLSLRDITAPEFREGRFQVCHYPESLSGPDGPPAFDQVLLYAHELHCRLRDGGAHVVAEYAEEERKFVAVLVGAFLVLARGWSSAQVCSRMREEARLVFPCSWGRQGCMRVQACWEGLQTARQLGWVHPRVIEDAAECSRAAAEHRSTIAQYDGSWLAPGLVFVMADPVTVVFDPNPQTCSEIFPPADEESLQSNLSPAAESSLASYGEHPAMDCVKEDEACTNSDVHPAFNGALIDAVIHGSGHSLSHLSPSPENTPDHRYRKWSEDSVDHTPPQRCRGVSEDRRSSAGSHRTSHRGRTFTGGSIYSGRNRSRTKSGSKSAINDLLALPMFRPSTASEASLCKEFVARVESKSSVLSVCKAFVQGDGLRREGGGTVDGPPPLLTFFKSRGITSMVRANMTHEPGLAELGGSYDARRLEPYGLQHADVPVRDTHGSVPDEGDIRIFLDVASQLGFDASNPDGSVGRALAVHCKSGFGRSVVFGCVLLIYLHDVPGRSLMGWSRIVRPGAIISPEEEKLLCKLGGRADLVRYCGVWHLQEAHGGSTTPVCGCSLQ